MRHRGLEPRTTWLKVKCSTAWASIPYFLILLYYTYFTFYIIQTDTKLSKMQNAQNRNRTSDTRIFSPLLYRLSYLGINCGSRIWTYDLRVMSPTSFQTAPSRDIHLVDGEGFEPSKASLTDLQSAPFGHSGTHPYPKADDRTRTDNLLITNQLLCQLSHIGIYSIMDIHYSNFI